MFKVGGREIKACNFFEDIREVCDLRIRLLNCTILMFFRGVGATPRFISAKTVFGASVISYLKLYYIGLWVGFNKKLRLAVT